MRGFGSRYFGPAISRLFGHPIFGDDVARAARQSGVVVSGAGTLGGGGGKISDSEAYLKRMNRLFRPAKTEMVMPNEPISTEGVFANLGGTDPDNVIKAKHTLGGGEMFADKMEEADALTGFIPKSVDMRKVLKKLKLDPDSLARGRRKVPEKERTRLVYAALQKELGPDFIFKLREGAASKGGLLTSSSGKLPDSLQRYMVQQRADLQPTSGVARTLDRYHALKQQQPKMSTLQRLLEAWKTRDLVGKVEGVSSATSKGTKEFRVHALGGKVVPYGTIRRGSGAGVGNPLHTFEMSRIEAEVQRALDSLPAKYRNTPYNFDVGITRQGKPVIIEANPAGYSGLRSEVGGLSGHPYVTDAVQAAIKGRLPYRILAQRAVLGTAIGAPTAVVGLHAARADQQDTKYDKIRRLMKRFR